MDVRTPHAEAAGGKYSVVALGTDSQNVQESTVRRFNRNLRDPVTGSVDLG